MLTPEFLLRIVESAEKKTEELNNYLTGKVARRILALFERKGKVELIPASLNDIQKMMETGKLTEEINQAVQERLPGIRKEVNKAFMDAAGQIGVSNEEFVKHVIEFEVDEGNMPEIKLPPATDYEKSGIPQKAADMKLTKKEYRLLERAYKQTNSTISNLTGTTASAWQKKYIEACNKAYWKATHGVSPSAAIREAIEECAEYGTTVKYPSGHTDRIETAIARAVRTGVNQAAGDISLTRCAETGVNMVIVSSHLGARYTDKTEPANHMSWQGKVYNLNWDSPALRKYEVTEQEREENKGLFAYLDKVKQFLFRQRDNASGDFIEVTGYGTGEGLCGWNCRHTFGPYYKGISVYNNKDFDSEENRRKADLEQKQREKERKIRELKRKKIVLKNALDGCDDEELKKELKEKYRVASDKLSMKNKDYENYCGETGLKTRQERIRVAQGNKYQQFSARVENFTAGEKVFYNEKSNYKVKLQGLKQEVNDSISRAIEDVCKKGTADGYEHMRFVNLSNGKWEYYETNGLPNSVGYKAMSWAEKHPDSKYAFIHNHNIKSGLSVNDLETPILYKNIPMQIASQNDGVIYIAERTSMCKTGYYGDIYFEKQLETLNYLSRSGKITVIERVNQRERILTECLEKEFYKKGIIKIDGRK